MRNLSKIIKNRKFKSIILLSFLLILYTLICATSYVKAISTELSDSVFRLHVIANSDTVEDQNLKYLVRDNIINYMNNISYNCKTKKEAIKLAKENIDIFKQIALETINNEGYNYDVNIEIGNFYFPTKQYGDISFPAGNYDALKIEIGDAIGQNWWCVMFPSLCFTDVDSSYVSDSSKKLLDENLSNEAYELVSDNSNKEIKFKFKLLEFFADNSIFTANK